MKTQSNKSGEKVFIKQTRSLNGRSRKFINSVKALGLGRIGDSREIVLNPAVAGMLRKVEHVVEISESKAK